MQTRSLLDDTRIAANGQSELAIQLERHSLFSADWYNSQLGENRLSAEDCKWHFDKFGWQMGLTPHPIFDTKFYLAENPDINAANINPLNHFLTRGIADGKSPHPLIDCDFIARQLGCGQDKSLVLKIYFNGAWLDGVSPSQWFDVSFATKKNRLEPNAEPLVQYLLCHSKARFRPHASFSNRTVHRQLAARGIDTSDPLSFYLTCDWRQMLRTRPNFLYGIFAKSRDALARVKSAHITADGPRPERVDESNRRIEQSAVDEPHAPARKEGLSARHKRDGRPIVFLTHPQFRFSASTILSSTQTASILSRHITTHAFSVTSSQDVSDSIVVVSKSVLKFATQGDIAALKKKNNILLGSFNDDPIDEAMGRRLDGLIASSICQFAEMKRICPDMPVFQLPPTVDERLPPPIDVKPQRIGYFGELSNTVSNNEIARHVDFFHVDTSRSGTDWMRRLPHYNCHYVLRQDRGFDGFKPPTKCFIAAHYLAPVIVEKSDREAQHYLGSDYPYLVASGDTAEILRTLEFVHSTYGTGVWQDAVERMAHVRSRSSHACLAQEFQAIIRFFS